MKPIFQALGFGAALALVAGVALAARPGNEYQLITQLNGQPVRWTLPDGGRSGIFTVYDGGVLNAAACMTLRNGTVPGPTGNASFVPSVLMMVPATPVVVCLRPGAESTKWDGGCNQIDTDENFGVPLQPYVPWYQVPQANSVSTVPTSLCAASDAGYIRMPVWAVQ